MGFETRQAERFFLNPEATFGDTSYTNFDAADGILLEALTVSKKLNRTVSQERSGTPDELVSQDARHSVTWQGNGLWAPSGALGTASDKANLLTALMGSYHAANLSTTVLAGATATGGTLASVTGLEVGDVAVITTAAGREPTRILTLGLLGDTPPTAPTATLAGVGAGSVNNGTHSYKVTFVNASGQTQLGAVSNTVTVADLGADGKVALTAISVGPSGTTARKVYRTAAGAAVTGPWKLLTTISDNTTVIYTDNTADSGLGVEIADTVTWDALTAAPGTGAVFVSGKTWRLTTAKPGSVALGIHETAEDEKEAVSGGIIQTATITLLDAGKPTITLSGEASDYHVSGITFPSSGAGVQAEVTGLVGAIYVDDAAFTSNQVEITFGQGAKMINRGIGVANPVDYIRNAKRTVRVKVDHYRGDYTLRDLAVAVTRSQLRCIIGQTTGAMLGAIMPSVEYEYPDASEDDGIRAASMAGIAYGDDGDDSLYIFEA